MKRHWLRKRVSNFIFATVCSVVVFGNDAVGQGTAFTYQGRLNQAASPANGTFDFAFSLFDTNDSGNQIGNTITNSSTPVTNGLFTVAMDFGGNAFTGSNLWLEISVRPAGSNVAFFTLSPRQSILATPYSIYARSAGSIALGGVQGVPNMQVFTNTGDFTVPLGVNRILVEVWGAGGGGGGGDHIGYGSGGGGGGGGFGKGVFVVTSGTTFTVTVGVGGSGGAGGSGGQAGGSSSFGTLISASGGSPGGSPPQYDYTGGVGGAGGTSSAHFNSDGARGSAGAVGSSLSYYLLTGHQSFVAGGAGGAAGAGGGGGGGGNANLLGTGGNGGNGSSPGGGGGGGGQGITSVGNDGGNGALGGKGRVVVYW